MKLMAMEKPPMPNASPDCKPLTTFVQTNTNAFREVVQRLTGPSSESTPSKEGEAAAKAAGAKKAPTSKLHERRKYMKPKLEIVKPAFPYKSGACVSPSNSKSRNSSFPPSPVSGSSSLLPSPITPSAIFSQLTLMEDHEKKEVAAVPELNREEEEKAIKERRFYLHPSPRAKPGFTEPELLPLFPIASVNGTEKV